MAILSGDVKLLKSSVMADVTEGGGAPTGLTITDGVSNAIFPDISELDRAGGRVSLRKTFVGVQTDDTDLYFGSNVIVADPPADPRVSVTLFATTDTFDERSDAANRVEAYLFSGPEWSGILHENHIAGQKAIQLFQRVGTALPPVGRTLMLVMNEGTPTEFYQYVRVISVSSVVQTFTFSDSSGNPVDYQALLVSCTLSDALRTDFPGSPASRLFIRATGKTVVRDTRVTDAAEYYGVSKLSLPVATGDFVVKAASIFTQLVPSAQTETALADQLLSAANAPMIQASATPYTFNLVVSQNYFKDGGTLQLPRGVTPGTFVGPQTTTDDGLGVVLRSGIAVGSIDYALGLVKFNTTLTGYNISGTVPVSFTPAAQTAQQTATLFRDVTAENRRFNWVETVQPIPTPGTFTFSYMAQGNWYVLTDNGNGELRGADVSFGAGTISYVTGTMSVTVGVMPDVGSAVMMTWATGAHYSIQTNGDVGVPGWTVLLSNLAGHQVERNSVTITWVVNSVTKTLTDNGSGLLVGNGWGMIAYPTGTIYFVMETLPDPGTTPVITYDKRMVMTETFTPTKDGNGFVSFTVAAAPIVPGSVTLEWETIRAKTIHEKTSGEVGGVSYYSSKGTYEVATTQTNPSKWQAATHLASILTPT